MKQSCMYCPKSTYLKNLLFIVLLLSTVKVFPQDDYLITYEEVFDENETRILDPHVFIDADNFIWYSTKNGLIKKAGNHKIFYPYPILPKTTQTSIVTMANPDTIIGLNGIGIFRFSLRTGEIDWLYQLAYWITSQELLSIKKDEEGNTWIYGQGKIFYYSVENTFKEFPSIKSSEGYENIDNFELILASKRGLIFQSVDGIFHYDFSELNRVEVSKERKQVYSIPTQNGSLFPKNTSGTFIVEGKKYDYEYFPHENIQVLGFPDEAGFDLSIYPRIISNKIYFAHKKGVKIWNKSEKNVFEKVDIPLKQEPSEIVDVMDDQTLLIKSDYGIIFLDPKNRFEKTKFYHQDKELKKTFSFRGIEKINNGNILALSYGGIFLLEKGEKKLKKIEFLHKKTKHPIDFGLYGLYKLNEETIIAYGEGYQLYQIDLKTNTYTEIVFSEWSHVRDMKPIGKDTFLMATGGAGLGLYNPNTKKISLHKEWNEELNLSNGKIEEIYYNDRTKELWLGLIDGGLIYKNLTTRKVVHFKEDNPDAPLIHDNVQVIRPGIEKDILWVGTENGVQKINTKTFKSNFYNFKKGPANNIASLIPTKDGLWLGTYDGLIYLNTKTGNQLFYYKENGLPDNEFNKNSQLKVNDSLFLFGGVKGVVAFNPKKFEAEERKDREIFLVEANYFDNRTKKNLTRKMNLKALESFQIPSEKNFLRLKVAINNSIDFNHDQIQYKVDDSDWINTGSYGDVYFQGLTPGDHALEIRGISKFGSSSNTLKYKITVIPLFYKTTWFAALIFSLIMSFVIVYFRVRKNRLHLELKYQLSQTNILRSQMNPHFIFNALNSIIRKKRNKKELDAYIANLSKLMRDTLESGRHEYCSVQKILEYLNTFIDFENRLTKNPIRFIVEKPFNFNEKKIEIPSMILQPIIENSVKHAFSEDKKDPKINLFILKDKNHLQIVIRDNGIGYVETKENQKKSSLAITILKERIGIWNALHKTNRFRFEIKKVTLPEFGTEVTLRVPFKERLI